MALAPFADRLTRWQRAHGRHDLPWQVSDPYRVWLSEIMLQQTQVATVIAYYQRFTASFPTVTDLAQAPLDDVLAHWAGLGYYTRARNLHKAAQKVMADFGGTFPQAAAQIETLPGIGRSTAAAIAGFCFAERTPILDGNVKRVLTRWAGIAGFPGEKKVENQLWKLAEDLLPQYGADMPAFTQGLMDLGATVCTRSKPACPRCPLREDCRAHIEGRTVELPTRKTKKAIPERETVMLLIQHEGKLLLEKRPPTGIWGGLWSLPQADSTATATTLCHSRFGLVVDPSETLPTLIHTFTHFRLTITPLVVTVRETLPQVAEEDSRWFTRSAALKAGIPTPVRKLLQVKPSPQATLFN
ncbi:A/G-specific adenine glycosylase [Chitinimonas sp. PSY-7]|uniref:A/G-specific adenine glycosylase n=1 Tax=Chitinimonas sp. PSY-7 TaxID=3459088 RepID=UPI00403FDD1E